MAKRKRKSGTGTVRLRKDGRWEGRIVVGYNEKGNPKTKNVLAPTKENCIEKLNALQNELAINLEQSNKNIKPEMQFGDWIDFWYKNYSKPKLRLTTQEGYENSIYNHIIPQLGNIPLNKLTQNDFQLFYAQLKNNGRLKDREKSGKGLSDRMIRACHAICRTALEKAVKENLIKENPTEGCKLPPKKTKEMQVLTTEEMQRFLIQAKEEDFYVQAILELSTGLRRGEFCALQWDDLNFKTGELQIKRQVNRVNVELRISEPKTRSSIRTLILPPSVLKILADYKKTVNSKWIFPSKVKEDSPLDPNSLRKKMQRILEHANCKVVRFHDLRHTFATTALEHGMDVKTLSSIIGHVSSATTLDIYSHVTDNMQLQAAKKIEKGIGKNEQFEANESPIEKLSAKKKNSQSQANFEPYKGKIRKPGTGSLYQVSENLWAGKYSPTDADGKKIQRNVFAKTREECEILLQEMIVKVKAEIAEEKERMKNQNKSA